MTQRPWLKLVLIALFGSAIAAPVLSATPARADLIINHPSSSRTQDHSHEHNHSDGLRHSHEHDHDHHHDNTDREITVEIIARGDAWADVYIEGRRLFSPRITNRRKTFRFRQGTYNIQVRGANYFDQWADGYLDISGAERASSTVILSFSETGDVRIAGRYHTWRSDLD